MPEQLTADQRALLVSAGPPVPSGDQTPEQALNLAVDGFRAACRLAGLEPIPSEVTIREAFLGL